MGNFNEAMEICGDDDAAMALPPSTSPQSPSIIVIPPWARPAAGEFCGTFLVTLFGIASNAQSVLAAPDQSGFLSLRFSWGVGLMLAVLVSAEASGAHLNPAITLALALYRGFERSKVFAYISAQVAGGLIAGVIAIANYIELIDRFEGHAGLRTFGDATSTSSAFVTVPQPYISNTGAFFNEVIGSALLCIAVFSCDRGAAPPRPVYITAIILGAALIGISGSFGVQTSFALNPARDLGPRIATAIFGYPSTVWTDRSGYFFYGAILGPVTGCLIGGLLHEILVGTGIKYPLVRVRSRST